MHHNAVSNVVQHVQSNASFGPIQNHAALSGQPMSSNRHLHTLADMRNGASPDANVSLQSIQVPGGHRNAVQQHQSNSSLNHQNAYNNAAYNMMAQNGLLNQQSSAAGLDGQ